MQNLLKDFMGELCITLYGCISRIKIIYLKLIVNLLVYNSLTDHIND
jgi:hypothetical protein